MSRLLFARVHARSPLGQRDLVRLLIAWLFMQGCDVRALLRLRMCEPTHRKRLAAGVLTILWAIDCYVINIIRVFLACNVEQQMSSKL